MDNGHWGKLLASSDKFSSKFSHVGDSICIIDCDLCGYAHQYPLHDVETYYEQDYFYANHAPPDWFKKVKTEHEEGLWRSAYKYQVSLLNSDLDIIDVGCGAGWFLDYWRKSNISGVKGLAFGVEPSQMARDRAGEMVNGFIYPSLEKLLETVVVAQRGANVRMSLLLEHLPNAIEVIEQYIPLLGKEGRLMIIVPNDFSPLQERIGKFHFVSPVHMNYFTPDSLQDLLQGIFEKQEKVHIQIDKHATFPMELFELLGVHYIGNDTIGRKCHRARLLFEKYFGGLAFELYKWLFSKYGWGREMMFVVNQKTER